LIDNEEDADDIDDNQENEVFGEHTCGSTHEN
jgi:hypothetical protein